MTALVILTSFLLAGIMLGGVTIWLLLRRKLMKATADWQSEAESLRATVDTIGAEWRERDHAFAKPAQVPNGFNMNRRPEAVRRIHAGVAIDKISTGTGWSVPEVALLQKIERLAEANRN